MLCEFLILIKKQIDYCLSMSISCYDSFLSSISERQKNPQSKQLKFIDPSKWQKTMIESLKVLSTKYPLKKNLTTDIITIVSLVPETNFVQATLKTRPFKPEFLQTIPILTTVTQSTMAETVIKNVRFQKCEKKGQKQIQKKHRITQKTLLLQFDKDYHPFKFIIKNFQRLIELKYKSFIDSKKITNISKLCSQLKGDMQIFSQFMHKASQPYKKLFKCKTQEEDQNSKGKFQQFVQSFLFDNEKLNKCIHRVILYATRFFFEKQANEKIPDFSTPQDFTMPEQFKIEGSYIRTINSLLQFSQLHHHEKCLKKLLEIRQNILVDINQYYLQKKLQKELQVSAEVQIEIIRFCLAKLKGWACQIFAQLKFLEYIYGEEDIGFKYQESSYMYTQLSMAFQILEIQTP